MGADKVKSKPISELVMMASPICGGSRQDPSYHVETLSDHKSDCELCYCIKIHDYQLLGLFFSVCMHSAFHRIDIVSGGPIEEGYYAKRFQYCINTAVSAVQDVILKFHYCILLDSNRPAESAKKSSHRSIFHSSGKAII